MFIFNLIIYILVVLCMQMKKLWLSLFSLIAIISLGVSFADIISLDYTVERCNMFKSVEVGNLRLVAIKYKSDWFGSSGYDVYEVLKNTCFNGGDLYLLDKNIDISEVFEDTLNEEGEKVNSELNASYLKKKMDSYYRTWIWSLYDILEPAERVPYPQRHDYVYKVVSNWSWLYETQFVEKKVVDLRDPKAKVKNKSNFLYGHYFNYFVKILWGNFVWILLLFLFAKIFLKKYELKNRKIIIVWILSNAITLFLWWFLLALLRGMLFSICVVLVLIFEVIIIKNVLKINRKMATFACIVCNFVPVLLYYLMFF